MEKSDNLFITGFQSLQECRQSILTLAKNIEGDISSTIVNAARIASMRSLLELFEKYNDILVAMKTGVNTLQEVEKLNHMAYEHVMNVEEPAYPENTIYMEKYNFWRGIAGEKHFDPYFDAEGRN